MYKLLFICLLLINAAQAQNRWYVPSKKELLTYPCFAISGVAKGYHDAAVLHYWKRGNSWIDPKISFQRKYKDFANGDMRPAYFGSKTFLVWTTDFSHLTEAVSITSFGAGVALNFADIKNELKLYKKSQRIPIILVRKILYPIVVRSLAFELIFKNLKS